MKVLVLGSSGFIGSAVAERFQLLGHEVYKHFFTRRPGGPDVCTDLTSADQVEHLFKSLKPDYVIHAAASTTGSKDTIERPWLHVINNAVMGSYIFPACVRHKVKQCLFFSCTVMYQPMEKPQKEEDWSESDRIYPSYFGVGSTKVYLEKMCDFYSQHGPKFTAFRHSNIYGPRDKFDLDKCHLLAAMIRKVIDAEDKIEVWGSGKAKRDLLYVDDLVDAVVSVMGNQEKQFELFNIGYGKAISIPEIIKEVSNILDKKIDIVYDKTKKDIPTTVVLDCGKAKDKLGWQPAHSFHEGLEKTIKWYLANKEQFNA